MVEKQLQNCARLRLLVDRWIDLAMELAKLRLEQDKPSLTESSRR